MLETGAYLMLYRLNPFGIRFKENPILTRIYCM